MVNFPKKADTMRNHPYRLTLILILALPLWFFQPPASAKTFDDMLGSHPSKSAPFIGEHKNIKWVSHTPDAVEDEGTYYGPNAEADDRGQVDEGKIDLDGDGKDEMVKVTWGHGVSDHSLSITVRINNKFVTLKPKGIQPNFKIADVDGDGKLEIVLWGAVSDPNMSQLLSDESKPFEGHSSPHLFTVSIYKLADAGYKLSKEYTSKKHYEPFCEEQPLKD